MAALSEAVGSLEPADAAVAASISPPAAPSSTRPKRRDANILLVTVLSKAAELLPELTVEERVAAFFERDENDGFGPLVILKCPCRPQEEFRIRNSAALKNHCQSLKHMTCTSESEAVPVSLRDVDVVGFFQPGGCILGSLLPRPVSHVHSAAAPGLQNNATASIKCVCGGLDRCLCHNKLERWACRDWVCAQHRCFRPPKKCVRARRASSGQPDSSQRRSVP